MKHSLKIGFSFGSTSGVITTLGLIIGLYYSTQSELAVIGGIISIAIADALSDAMGIHMSEESEHKHSHKEIWESTLSAFACKFIFAITFIIPVLLLEMQKAIQASIVWGLFLVAAISYYVAKKRQKYKAVIEHLIITAFVIIITYFVGKWIHTTFGVIA
ncbi:hypothetical protein GF374_00215 [Candidatus Woesearchaeota archaeon]|nr:hypothetical protein [Candidatus Woesearchaeota archaeon]